MLVVAGVALFVQSKVTGDALDRDWLNPLDFIRNLLLIQEWGPQPQRGWNFVAWSLSMEWLAYLIFPILILVIWRCNKRLGLPVLIALWIACIAPLIGYGLSRTDSYYTDNWGSTIRILTEFTAGALTYLIIRRLLPEGSDDPSRRTLQAANALSWLFPLAVISGAVLLAHLAIAQPPVNLNASGDAEPMPPYFHLLLVPFLIAWLGALALARGRVSRGLATKTLVLGGFISYSLYMTHLVVFGLWRAAMRATGIDGGLLYAAGLLLLVATALVIAWLMWRFVEEPAREWMRGLAGVRRTPTEEAGEAIAERRRSGPEPVTMPSEFPTP